MTQIFRRADRGVAIGYDPDDTYGAVVCESADELAARMWGSEIFRLVYYPDPEDPDLGFVGVCELVKQYQLEKRAAGDMRQMALAIDELALYPSAYDERGTLAFFCRQGRHSLMDLSMGTQYPLELPRFARTAMTRYHFFQNDEANAVEFVRKLLGKERAEQVKTLPRFTPLTYNRETREITPPLPALTPHVSDFSRQPPQPEPPVDKPDEAPAS